MGLLMYLAFVAFGLGLQTLIVGHIIGWRIQ